MENIGRLLMSEIKEKKLQILLTQRQYLKLKKYAQRKQVSMGDLLRRYIDRLPNLDE